jgi:hypothetical protein
LSFRFCEEDIDQILERRTQVITIDSVGQGSTFAKVSLILSAVYLSLSSESKYSNDVVLGEFHRDEEGRRH